MNLFSFASLSYFAETYNRLKLNLENYSKRIYNQCSIKMYVNEDIDKSFSEKF